jgi:hypothetical protein
MQRKEKRKEEGRRRKKVLHGRAGSCRKDLARDQTPRGRPLRPTAGSRRPWVGFFFFFFLPVPVSDFFFFFFFEDDKILNRVHLPLYVLVLRH